MIRFNEPYLSGKEKDYLNQVIEQRFFFWQWSLFHAL